MDYNIVERDEINPLEERQNRNVEEGQSKDRSRGGEDDDDYDNTRSRGNRSNSRN